MSWNTSAPRQRLEFVTLASTHSSNFRELCRRFSISAPTGYKWLTRYRHGGLSGLEELSRKPHRNARKRDAMWRNELITLRRRHPAWGAKKLHCLLLRAHPRSRKAPCSRTLGRWLKAMNMSSPRPPRHRPGPRIDPPALSRALSPNDVWTIDFKGWFRTADLQRCDPLTVRDLFSRYLLCVCLVREQSDASVRRVMTGLFRKHGLPRVIRADNGSPFAGRGAPLKLTTLSAWWMRLGIRVEFTRPGKPQDNAAHEQMHRILKAETTSPPAANSNAQQRRMDCWMRQYNTLRPHEALNGRPPADLYHPSQRPFHVPPAPSYPGTWLSRSVRPNGWIRFEGSLRFIGRAFARQKIGLQPAAAGSWNVHLGNHLIGTLHRCDGTGSMRATTFITSKCKPSLVHPCVKDVVS